MAIKSDRGKMASEETGTPSNKTAVLGRLKRVWQHPVFARWRDRLASDDHNLMAAGVAFFAFLAIAPLVASLALTYGLLAPPDVLAERLMDIRRLFPADTAAVLEEPIRMALEGASTKQGLALALSLALAVFGARGAASAIISALNSAYDRQETRSFLRLQMAALVLTVAMLVAIMVSFGLVSLIGLIGTDLLPANRLIEWLVSALTLLTFIGISTAVVASLYRWAPDHPEALWCWITPGTVLTAICWFALSIGFSWYASNIGRFGAAYGSLAAIAALLTWLYFSALAMFLGASLNRAIEEVRVRPPDGEQLADEVQ